MRRHTVIAQLIVFGVIAVLVVGYAVFELLGVKLTNRPYHVSVQLATAGGIFSGAEVAYRGVQVGTVSSLTLHPDSVTIVCSIDHGTRIPVNAVAHIYDLSAAGEQYVDFIADKPAARYLHAGSVVGQNHTTTPLQVASVLYDLEQFVDSIKPADIAIIAQQGSAAFGNLGPQMHALISQATDLISQLAQSKGQTVDLLRQADVLLQGAAAHGSDFDQFATSLNQLTATLAASTPTIEKFLNSGEATTRLVNAVITSNASAFGVLMANLATLSGIQVSRLPGLSALLVAVPQFAATAPKTVADGAISGAADVDQDDRLCSTGLALTSPISGVRSAGHDVGCPASVLPRGAGNAPQPGGAASASAAAAVSLDPGADPATPTQVGTYDPTDGLSKAADGTVVRLAPGLADPGGAQSWQDLFTVVRTLSG